MNYCMQSWLCSQYNSFKDFRNNIATTIVDADASTVFYYKEIYGVTAIVDAPNTVFYYKKIYGVRVIVDAANIVFSYKKIYDLTATTTTI